MRFSNDQVSSAYDEYLDALEYDEELHDSALNPQGMLTAADTPAHAPPTEH